MTGNQIRKIDTQLIDGGGAVIMVSLDVFDLAGADAFVGQVVQTVLAHRMVSPPDTRMLCITLMGPMSSRTFANLWFRHVQAEPAMATFMGMMTDADVLHGTPQGQILDQTSLLQPPPSRAAGPGPAQPAGGGLFSKARSLFRGKGG